MVSRVSSMKVTESLAGKFGLSALDWCLCGASLRSPFSNFRFGMFETGSICDGGPVCEARRRIGPVGSGLGILQRITRSVPIV